MRKLNFFEEMLWSSVLYKPQSLSYVLYKVLIIRRLPHISNRSSLGPSGLKWILRQSLRLYTSLLLGL